jgi:hypothetical protein
MTRVERRELRGPGQRRDSLHAVLVDRPPDAPADIVPVHSFAAGNLFR